MSKKEVAIRKKQKIAKASKNMFITVAVTSFVVGIAVVATGFLAKKIIFNQKVINAKNETVNNLKANNSNFASLEENIKILSANEALSSLKVNPTQDAIGVVLDALPANGNSTAFGASLKEKILNVDNVKIENLTVNTTQDEMSGGSTSSAASTTATTTEKPLNTISFTFKVIGSITSFNDVLRKIEKSIRPIAIDAITLETGNDTSYMTVSGHTNYQPELRAELKTKTIKADK